MGIHKQTDSLEQVVTGLLGIFANRLRLFNLAMHLSENEGIEGKTFVVTGGLGFVGSALCLELLRRGARQVRAFDIRLESPWSEDLRHRGVCLIQGEFLFLSILHVCVNFWIKI